MVLLEKSPVPAAPAVCAGGVGGTPDAAAAAAVLGGRGWSRTVAEAVVGGPKSARLARLTEQVRHVQARWRPVEAGRCTSGMAALDVALGGGWATAAIHELVAAEDGAAVHTVALCAAARAAGYHKWIIYVDTQRDLYPPGVGRLGVPLDRLIVVRTTCTIDALWVCEQTLRCRAVGAVVVPLRTVEPRAARRLQLAAESGGGLGLLLCRDGGGGGTFAASRVRFEPVVGTAGVRGLRVTVLKLREGRPREPFVVELSDAANSVPVHAVSGDRAGVA